MPSRPVPRDSLDVYLMPSVIGGGLGDVAEVRSAGAWLSEAGFRVRIFRRAGHAWPRGMPGPFDWPSRISEVGAKAPRALTISSQFGVTCAPGRAERLGRAGEWAEEVVALERVYGPDRVLHVSLEEFARTLTSRRQIEEREREGGVPSRVRVAHRRSRRARDEEREAHELYRKFRAFDRPNLLTLFPTFGPVAAFSREFPEAIQVGPIWPHGLGPRPGRSHGGRRLLWYASPSTSDRLAGGVMAGLEEAGPGVTLVLRSPRGLSVPPAPGVRVQSLEETGPGAWVRTWEGCDLAIVSGSRTLLEAIVTKTPFLYYNGLTGRPGRARRHRPEKLDSLLRSRSAQGVDPVRRDLQDFARGRRVRAIVANRLRVGWAGRSFAPTHGFPPGHEDGGGFVVRLAQGFAHVPSGTTAAEYAAHGRAPKASRSPPPSHG